MTAGKHPFGSGAIKASDEVRGMFDRIVPRYDLMNRLMTGGRDVAWRRLAVREALRGRERAAALVLDVATGTGDIAIALRHAGAGRVVGIDFSGEMLREAKRKAGRPGVPNRVSRRRWLTGRGVASPTSALTPNPSPTAVGEGSVAVGRDGGTEPRVAWVEGDGMAMPFADGTFDAVTVGFGLRNMPSYAGALREMARVLRPGGTLVCLETTPVTRPALRTAFDWAFSRVVPLVGGLLSGDRDAYAYLPASAAAFPDADTLGRIMIDAGLCHVRYLRLGMGTVALHVGRKPGRGLESAVIG